MKLKLSVLATLFALAVCPATADTVVWGNGSGWTMGGSVKRYAKEINRLYFRGDSVEVRGTSCTSACNLILFLSDRVCTEPQVRWAFHMTSVAGLGVPMWKSEQEKVDNLFKQAFAAYPGLWEWYRDNARDRYLPTTLTGQQMHDTFGVNLCPDQ